MAAFLTNSGRMKLLAASPENPVKVLTMAIGEGSGTPTENMGALFNEVFRVEIPNPLRDINAPTVLHFTGTIPVSVGGFEITEAGLFDAAGVLLAYVQLEQPIVKPDPSGPLPTTLEIRFSLQLDNAEQTTMIVTESTQYEHNQMTNRNAPDAHPMAAVTGLVQELTSIRSDFTSVDSTLDSRITLLDSQNVKLANAQTITGVKTFVSKIFGSISGSSATLEVPRNLVLVGDATATLEGFDGSKNIAAEVTLKNSGATAGTYKNITVNAKGLITSARQLQENFSGNANAGYYFQEIGNVILIKCWGRAAFTPAAETNEGEVTVTFPYAMTSGCMIAAAMVENSTGTKQIDHHAQIKSKSTTGATFVIQGVRDDQSPPTHIQWWAEGFIV